MSLSIVPSATGRIQKVMLIDTVKVEYPGEYSSERGAKEFLDIIRKMSIHGIEGMEFWIMIQFNYNISLVQKSLAFLSSRGAASSNIIQIVDEGGFTLKEVTSTGALEDTVINDLRLKETEYARTLENALVKGMAQDEKSGFSGPKIVVIYPNLDFAKLAKEIEASYLLYASGTDAVLTTMDKYAFGQWVQDYFVVMRTANNMPVLLDPYYASAGKFTEKYVADQVAEQQDVLLKPTNLVFEGGNILAEDGFVILGSNVIRNNIMRGTKRHPSGKGGGRLFAAVIADMRSTFGVSEIIVPLRSEEELDSGIVTKQSNLLFHIDLYITLGGKNEQGKHRIFIAQLYTTVFDAENFRAVFEVSKEAIYLDRVAKWFEAYQDNHGDLKFSVSRLPAIVTGTGAARKLFSYNNCLIEPTEKKPIAYIPHYVPTKDEEKCAFGWATKEVDLCFRNAGMTPIMLSCGFYKLARDSKSASLHCMTKVIQRTMK